MMVGFKHYVMCAMENKMVDDMLKIGVTGYARHGKDTIADYLVLNYKFQKIALADVMKEVISIIFGWSREYIEQHKDEIDNFWGVTPRYALQTLGTEWGQHILGEFNLFEQRTGRLLWTKQTYNYIQKFFNNNENVVISDIRFLHEAKYLKDKGFIIWRVNRPNCPFKTNSHASESEINKIEKSWYIDNKIEGNLGYLYDQIDTCMKTYKNWGLIK